MKTPEEIKAQAIDEAGCCGACEFRNATYDHPYGCSESQAKVMIVQELVQYTERLESTISQVSKALCGKENATLDEILQAVDQLKKIQAEAISIKLELDAVKRNLAQVERERDAAVRELKQIGCSTCAKYDRLKPSALHEDCVVCVRFGFKHWQWRGPCPENTI